MTYRPTIGLEIHAELSTQTKMFCNSANNLDEAPPNTNICPVCLAHPGTLPFINREAVKHVLRVGVALGGTLADYSEFDRKSYFYPDIPKGYQISQYAYPLVSGGSLADIDITRVHLEEDTARSTHQSPGKDDTEGRSLLDFNRAGIPLMELVTEPVIHDAETAGKFARELQLLLRTLGVSKANLEKGEMRIEANISISKTDSFGTKVEVKNLNSFRSVERAIAYEAKRQEALIESGGSVVQETRGWHEGRQETFSQRLKEGSADYRYFPDPDLPKLILSEIPEFAPEVLVASLPELPWERRARYIKEYGIKDVDAIYISADADRVIFFDAVTKILSDVALIRLAVNYIVTDLAGIYAKKGSEEFTALDANAFVELMRMITKGDLSSRGAKDTLALLVEEGGDPETLAKKHGLIQVSDPVALEKTIATVIAAEPKAVAEYRSGKEAALQFLLGKAMKESHGAGNPQQLRELFIKEIS